MKYGSPFLQTSRTFKRNLSAGPFGIHGICFRDVRSVDATRVVRCDRFDSFSLPDVDGDRGASLEREANGQRRWNASSTCSLYDSSASSSAVIMTSRAARMVGTRLRFSLAMSECCWKARVAAWFSRVILEDRAA